MDYSAKLYFSGQNPLLLSLSYNNKDTESQLADWVGNTKYKDLDSEFLGLKKDKAAGEPGTQWARESGRKCTRRIPCNFVVQKTLV